MDSTPKSASHKSNLDLRTKIDFHDLPEKTEVTKQKVEEGATDALWNECFTPSKLASTENIFTESPIFQPKTANPQFSICPRIGLLKQPKSISSTDSGEINEIDEAVEADHEEIEFLGTVSGRIELEAANSDVREKLANIKLEKELAAGISPEETLLKVNDPAIVAVVMNTMASSRQSSSSGTSPHTPTPTLSLNIPTPPAVGAPISSEWLHQTYRAFLEQATTMHKFMTDNMSMLTAQNQQIRESVKVVENKQDVQARELHRVQNQVDFLEKNMRNGSTLLVREHGLNTEDIKDPEKRKQAIKKLFEEALELKGEDKNTCRVMKTEWIRPKNRVQYSKPGYQPTIRSNYVWDFLCSPEINFGARLRTWHQKNGRPKFSIFQDLSRRDLEKKNFAIEVVRKYRESFRDADRPKVMVTQYFGIREGEGQGEVTSYVRLKEKYGRWFPARPQPYVMGPSEESDVHMGDA